MHKDSRSLSSIAFCWVLWENVCSLGMIQGWVGELGDWHRWLQYGEYITAYFTSSNANSQAQVPNLDKAIRRWSGSVNNVLLDQFEKYRFLEVWHIFSKAIGEQMGQGSQQGGSGGQWIRGFKWRSKDACWLFDQGKCTQQVTDCWYQHVCHLWKGRKHWKGLFKQEGLKNKGGKTTESENVPMGTGWRWDGTNSVLLTNCKTVAEPSWSSHKEWGKTEDDLRASWVFQNLLLN